MRPSGRGPALLAALAVLAALAGTACKPSSLTPGWIGTRGPEDTGAAAVASGLWSGPTSNGGVLHFQVVDGEIADFFLQGEGPCRRVFNRAEPFEIAGTSFAFTYEIDSGGFFSIEGSFPAPQTCVGTYSYSGVAVNGTCPRAAAGSFTAAVGR